MWFYWTAGDIADLRVELAPSRRLPTQWHRKPADTGMTPGHAPVTIPRFNRRHIHGVTVSRATRRS